MASQSVDLTIRPRSQAWRSRAQGGQEHLPECVYIGGKGEGGGAEGQALLSLAGTLGGAD